MSILDINSLLSTIPSYPVGPSTAGGNTPVTPTPVQPENGDRFTRGQFWKNLAGPLGAVGGSDSTNTYTRSAVAPRVQRFKEVSGSEVPQGEAVSQDLEATSAEDSSSEENVQETGEPTRATGEPLTQSEKSMIETLKKADQAVRAHEMAHLSAAGGFAKGGATFKMQKGPDGQSYAVGGEVQIDMSKASTPEMTVQKMRTVRRAALAPIDPSPQDQRVAAQATINISQAAQELNFDKLQPGEPGQQQEKKGGDDQVRVSAGDVYQDYGQSVINPTSEQEGSSSLKRSMVAYGQTSTAFRGNGGESALEVIA